jgi:hypothetical protein
VTTGVYRHGSNEMRSKHGTINIQLLAVPSLPVASVRVEEAAVSTSSNLIDDIGLEVNVKGTGNVFSGRGFREGSGLNRWEWRGE